ncbi:MAG: LysE family transporter [Paracoccaceae bacterium]|nr:LysE family transporter [Paracoccaceae bacterium]
MIDPLYFFVFAGLFSPGPNVILLSVSGAVFGFRRTVPHILGVAIGVGLTAGLTGLGIAALLAEVPLLEVMLKVVAAGWILFMAFRLFMANRPEERNARRPFRFHEAVLFQWVNPKVWAVALAAASGYASGQGPMEEGMRLAIAFAGINFFVCMFWTWAGQLLSFLLTTPVAWKLFLRVMAAALAASAAMIFL